MITDAHEGVDSKDPGGRVPGSFNSGGGDWKTSVNDWGQLWNDILVADQSQGNDVDVPDLLFQGGLWDLVKGPGQVWDNDFVDNLGFWGAELAKDMGWEGSDPGLCNAGRLDQLRQAGDGQ